MAVDGEVKGRIEQGLLVLLGVGGGDEPADADALALKAAGLRCFEDGASKFNLSVTDVGGSILAISQFTLYGDCRKGRRPSFSEAAEAAAPELAIPLYERFCDNAQRAGDRGGDRGIRGAYGGRAGQ